MSFRNSVQETMTRGYRDISVDKIRCNPINFYAHSKDEDLFVGQMEELIQEQGQDVNAVVYMDDSLEDGKMYTLLSGERRYKAILKLYEQHQGDGMMHVKIIDKPADADQEMIQIISNNAIRHKSKDTRLQEVAALHEIWKHMVNAKTAHGRFNEWCASRIGISPRSVTNYLKKIQGDSESSDNDSTVEDSDDSSTSEESMKDYEDLLTDRFGKPVKINAKNHTIQIKFKSNDEIVEFVNQLI